MTYTNKQSSFNSSVDNTKIFYQSWKKPNANRLLVIQHGFGELSDRYKNILEKLKDSEFSIYALDSRGHGRSEGIRGHVDQFQYYVEDLSDLVHIALEERKTSSNFSPSVRLLLRRCCSSEKRRMQFSTMTTAPSMMMPKSSAPRLIKLALILLPAIPEMVNSMDNGMTIAAITAARKFPRNTNRTIMTSKAPRTRFSVTVSIVASTRVVRL